MWVNCHHIMSRLAAAGNRVLFVESPGLRPPTAGGADLGKTARRAVRFCGGVRKVRENLHAVGPIVLPWVDSPLVLRTNRRLLEAVIRQALRRLKMTRPVFWSFLPTGELAAEAARASVTVYHCVDDYAANPGVPAALVRRLERQMVERADLVFATSRPLADRLATMGTETHCLPNVADVAHFATAGDAATVVPDDIAKISQPRIGFVGNLAGYKVDLSLLRRIAEQRPGWSLVLIGPVGWGDPGTDLAALGRMPNVHLLGPRPYEQLPAYLKGMDVCLLVPPVDSATAASSFPLKFWEYVAAGRPVVGRWTDALSEMAGRDALCKLVREDGDFVAAIEAAMASDGPAARAARVDACRGQTWEERIDRMLGLIERERQLKMSHSSIKGD